MAFAFWLCLWFWGAPPGRTGGRLGPAGTEDARAAGAAGARLPGGRGHEQRGVSHTLQPRSAAQWLPRPAEHNADYAGAAGQWACAADRGTRDSCTGPLRIIPRVMFGGPLKAPFQGDGGSPLAMKAERSGALMAKGVNKSRNTGVSRCCTRPVSGGQRSQQGWGLPRSEPGAALARLRAAVNTRRRCKRRDRRSEAVQSPGQAAKEE